MFVKSSILGCSQPFASPFNVIEENGSHPFKLVLVILQFKSIHVPMVTGTELSVSQVIQMNDQFDAYPLPFVVSE